MKFLNLKHVAEILQCHPSTIYRWVGERKIPYIKNGHRLLFSSEDIENWILDHRVPTIDEELFKSKKHYDNEKVR